MLKAKGIQVLAMAVAALCTVGLIRLFVLRYEAGDVYAAYSSLRSDPKGSKVLCESLNRLPGIAVTRNFRDLSQWTGLETGRTIVLAGYSLWTFRYQSEEEIERLQDLAARGNRVVIALAPTTMRDPHESDAETARKIEEVLERRRNNGRDDEEETWEDVASLEGSWQLGFRFVPFAATNDARYARLTIAIGDEEVQPRAPWNSTAVFTDVDPAWQGVGYREDAPVMLQRSYGMGSIVLCSDSYFLSNEAMLHERNSDLLVWLLGAHNQIVFDETHLGVTVRPGVAALIRQYRLHGLVAALLALAGLIVWRSLFGLVRRPEDGPATAEVEGKDHAEGLVNLLQQHIPSRELLSECERTWHGSASLLPHRARARRAQVEAVLAEARNTTHTHRPQDAYRRVQDLLIKDK